MATDQSSSNQKRQRKNENDSTRKSQRLLDQSDDQPMKLTDLNDNCLEKIFGHLDLSGLFNVAVANEYLRPAAGIAYKRKFGTIQVCLKNDRLLTEDRSEPHIFHKWIYVDGLKTSLRYLRCLGSSVGDLCIRYDGWSKTQCDYIHQYMNEYCADSLVHIELREKKSGMPFKCFDKPFVNVRTVKAHDSYLGKQIPSFAQWFPNVRVLELLAVHIGWFSSNSTAFHHLEDLHIGIDNYKRGFKTEMATRLLQLCPQVNNVTIRARTGKGITLDTLSNIIKNNSNICRLKVNTRPLKTRVFSSDVQQLVNEHPTLVELDLNGYKFTVEAAMSLVRQLNSLKKFRFEISVRLEYNRILSQLDSKWQPMLHEWFRNYCVKLQC